MQKNQSIEIGALLLEIGALLMSAGANTNRIRLTMRRIAKSYGYKAEYLITHRAIMLT
ncbi:MAG: threonine/serine exporter family protein, partial [Mangrovimonas sp.]|nr:threonine/serine exporter family protein [Mangrovimonas sp.]